MKNSQKVFVVPLLIAIIAVLVIGGGVYIYENKRTEVPSVQTKTNVQVPDQSAQNTIHSPAQNNNSSVPIPIIVSKYDSGRGVADQSDGYFTITSPVTTSSKEIKITSPFASQSMTIGSQANIVWNPNTLPVTVFLTPDFTCLGVPCAIPTSYLIAAQKTGSKFTWNVGSVVGDERGGGCSPSGTQSSDGCIYDNPLIVRAGNYRLSACNISNGPHNCSSAIAISLTDATSNQASSVPDINIVSPNGGELWQSGSNQTVTVNVTGDPTKVGDNVSLILLNLSNNTSDGYSLGGCQTNNTPGTKTCQVQIPSNEIPGHYKIYATLTKSTSSGTCNLSPGYVGCVTPPITQAYDSSDGWFVINSAQSSNNGPTINGIDGPTQLSVNQSGTWTIRASDSQSPSLSYGVDWGDNTFTNSSTRQTVGFFSSSPVFSHAYTASGIYTTIFTVLNRSGWTQSKIMVLVQ